MNTYKWKEHEKKNQNEASTVIRFKCAVRSFTVSREFTYATPRHEMIDSNWWHHISLIGVFFLPFFSHSDPRALEYTFMNNPLPTLGMVATYLAWVLIIGPIYMRDRKPMNIKNTIIVYNAFQVLLSAYMFYEVSARPTRKNNLFFFKSLCNSIQSISNFIDTIPFTYIFPLYRLASDGRMVEKLQLELSTSWL